MFGRTPFIGLLLSILCTTEISAADAVNLIEEPITSPAGPLADRDLRGLRLRMPHLDAIKVLEGGTSRKSRQELYSIPWMRSEPPINARVETTPLLITTEMNDEITQDGVVVGGDSFKMRSIPVLAGNPLFEIVRSIHYISLQPKHPAFEATEEAILQKYGKPTTFNNQKLRGGGIATYCWQYSNGASTNVGGFFLDTNFFSRWDCSDSKDPRANFDSLARVTIRYDGGLVDDIVFEFIDLELCKAGVRALKKQMNASVDAEFERAKLRFSRETPPPPKL